MSSQYCVSCIGCPFNTESSTRWLCWPSRVAAATQHWHTSIITSRLASVNRHFACLPSHYWTSRSSSSSCMRVINHNWSATKQRLHPQSVAEISFVRGRDSTMWNIVWVSPQAHRSVSVSRRFLLRAPQCPCSVRKLFSRGRSKLGCRIVGSHTRWELTTWADFQLCLHRLLMSTGCKSSHSGFLDDIRSNGGLTISGGIGQVSCVTIFSTSFVGLAV